MRINCINVEDLSDQHLRAEWLEFLMLVPYIRRSMKSKNGIQLSESKNYTLGTGHAKFFYDKLLYVQERYNQIQEEMKSRGFNTNPKLDLSNLPDNLFNMWTPTKTDHITNLNRIIARIDAKPDWYKFKSKNVGDWHKFYEERYDFNYVYHDSHYGNK